MATAVLEQNAPWLDKAISLVGVHEAPGSADNPAIMAWAKFCGGNIEKVFTHDSIAWCALFVNYCLISTGQQGDDSLLALDFQHYGRKLPGPAVGAIVCRHRDGGGHVMIVGGRDSQGRLVGIGGNVSDEVKQQTFTLAEVVGCNWPAGYPAPASTDFDDLPLIDGALVQSAAVHAPDAVAPAPRKAAGAASAAIASGISQRAFDFIVTKEVTDQRAYEQLYRWPTWPGASSGVTIGIGYDVGQGSEDQLRADWGAHLSAQAIDALADCVGVTGAQAQGLAQSLRGQVDVSWADALAVFRDVAMPRWVGIVRRALPNVERLSPDCLGALVSLTYNRGASFSKAGERYTEMRAIKQHMADMRLDLIPDEIRAMRRLWPDLRGLRDRRDGEAALFEQGLSAAAAPPVPGEVIATGSAAGGIAVAMGGLLWLEQNPFVVGLMIVGLYAGIKALSGLRQTTTPGGGKMANGFGNVLVKRASMWVSKIGWTQIVGAAAQVVAYTSGGKVGLTPDQQIAVATSLGLLQSAVTWVIKWRYTSTITPTAAALAEKN